MKRACLWLFRIKRRLSGLDVYVQGMTVDSASLGILTTQGVLCHFGN